MLFWNWAFVSLKVVLTGFLTLANIKGKLNMKTINIKTMGRSILSMTEHQNQLLSERYESVKNRMEKAYNRFKPVLEKPELVAVSKTFTADEIAPLLDLGQRVFGENRVQEAMGKWPELKKKYADVELHLIGPLQTNKVEDALKLFDVIQTVDREKLAKYLSLEMKKREKNIPCFVQVNIGQEQQKSGIAPDQVEAFVINCRDNYDLDIVGLMCIPPFHEPAGPYFAHLNKLAKAVKVLKISMGMSSDFETAIEMGATHVRVGTALFGTR